jgi:hypothetical protein
MINSSFFRIHGFYFVFLVLLSFVTQFTLVLSSQDPFFKDYQQELPFSQLQPSLDSKDLGTEDSQSFDTENPKFESHQSASSFNPSGGGFITTSSKTIYVSSLSGNDKNNGSKEFPVKTLEHAVFLLQKEGEGGGNLDLFSWKI